MQHDTERNACFLNQRLTENKLNKGAVIVSPFWMET